MPTRYYANAPATTLAASCTSGATSITVSSVAGFPISYPYTLIIDKGQLTEEAVSVTAAAGTVLTVTRGIDSTPAFAHVQGAAVEHGITAQDIREANTHVNASSGVHGLAGSVVGTTDAQHLTNKTAATPATADNDTKLATTAFVKAALLAANPVGAIYMSTSSTNPSSFIGGTWVAWGTGRVPVGIDAGQAEFDSVEETGGAKTHTLSAAEMPVHAHSGTTGSDSADHTHGFIGGHTWAWGDGTNNIYSTGVATAGPPPGNNLSTLQGSWVGTGGRSAAHSHAFNTGNAGSGAAHNNLQPYIVCYMFKRTA